jgi:hypothetical protein
MRPLVPGGDGLPPAARPRSRKSSVDHLVASSHVPTAFFMRSEEEMAQSLATTSSSYHMGRQRDSTFGVQSLEDTLDAAFGPQSKTPKERTESASSTGSHEKHGSRTGLRGSLAGSMKPSDSSQFASQQTLKRKLSRHVSSTNAPATPLDAGTPSPAPASVMSSTPSAVSLHSIKLSDEDSAVDDVASQAITSSGEEEAEDADVNAQQGAAGSFPQLVMPSIQMPARRPFTTKGKAMGKLKILVAGESGNM